MWCWSEWRDRCAMTTTTQRTTDPGLALILAGVVWDLVMTTLLFSLVDIPDGLWFLLDAPGMALIAIGFARYSPEDPSGGRGIRALRGHAPGHLHEPGRAGLPPRTR